MTRLLLLLTICPIMLWGQTNKAWIYYGWAVQSYHLQASGVDAYMGKAGHTEKSYDLNTRKTSLSVLRLQLDVAWADGRIRSIVDMPGFVGMHPMGGSLLYDYEAEVTKRNGGDFEGISHSLHYKSQQYGGLAMVYNITANASQGLYAGLGLHYQNRELLHRKTRLVNSNGQIDGNTDPLLQGRSTYRTLWVNRGFVPTLHIAWYRGRWKVDATIGQWRQLGLSYRVAAL